MEVSVATPERVALELPVAGVGYRSMAYLIDLLLIAAFCVVAFFVYSLFVPDVVAVYEGLSSLGRVLVIVGVFATQWMYWTAAEVFWNGQTPGKHLARIRVVRHDGAPAGFFESAVRNLCRLLDFLPVFYALGLLVMLLDRQHRRVGDLLAGTMLVREEKIDLDKYAPRPVDALPVSRTGPPLGAEDVELILQFLSRRATLTPQARERLARKLVARYASELPEQDRAALSASTRVAEAWLERHAAGR